MEHLPKTYKKRYVHRGAMVRIKVVADRHVFAFWVIGSTALAVDSLQPGMRAALAPGGRTFRVAAQRNFAQLVIALCSVVVAVCAVVVTVKVLNTEIAVKQQRVLDQAALERQVADEVNAIVGEVRSVACPVAVVVEVDRTFSCRVQTDPNPKTVDVRIVDDQGWLSIEVQ